MKRWRSKKHLMKLAEMPCMFCGLDPCGEPHHIRSKTNGGMGMKPSDYFTITTCHRCHSRIHHEGEGPFFAEYGLTIEEVIETAQGLCSEVIIENCKFTHSKGSGINPRYIKISILTI